MSRRKRILLTGNCEYELLGLSHLLAGMGYAVVRPEMSPSGAYDLALVALSAEPLAGWGRHLQGIRTVSYTHLVRRLREEPGRKAQVN